MLHEVNQLSTKKCANLQCGSSSVPKCGSYSIPKSIFLNSTFLLFLASIVHLLPQVYQYSMNTSFVFPKSTYYSPSFYQDLYLSLDSYILY